jgi:hypothetical protein
MLDPTSATPPAPAFAPDADAILKPLDSAIQAIQSQPWGIHLVVGSLLIFGLLLWVFGRRLLRPLAALIGGGLGGVTGYVLLPTTFPDSGLSPYFGMLAGLVIGLLLALFLFKVATAAAFGVAVGIAAMMISTGVLARTSTPPALNPSAGQRVADAVKEAIDGALAPASAEEPAATATPAEKYPNLEPLTKAVRELARTARAEVAERWRSIPDAHKPWVGLSGAGGLLVGFLLGFLMPKWSSEIVTGLLGAAIWLAAGVWLWHAFALPGSESLTRVAPMGWALVWGFAGVLGALLQAKLTQKKKPEPAPARDESGTPSPKA